MDAATDGSSTRMAGHLRKLAETEGRIRCGICGRDLSGHASVCRLCETPYHPDCWKYNGGCAVFGCRAAPAPPEPMTVEVRFARSRPPKAVLLLLGITVALALYPASAWLSTRGKRETLERLNSLSASAHTVASRPPLPPSSKPSSVDEFVRDSKGADWEGRVFFLRSLASSREPKALEHLLAALEDDEAIGNVREAAARVLGESGWKQAIPALDRRLESERVGQVLGELALALHRLGSLSGRRAVERWLSEYPPGSAAPTIADSDRRTRAMFAAEAAARAKMADLRPTIERYLTSSDSWVVGYTIHNLAQLGGAESAPAIARFLEDPDCHRAYAAAEALVTMGAKNRRAEIERGLGRCKEFIHLIPRLLARLDSGGSHAGRR